VILRVMSTAVRRGTLSHKGSGAELWGGALPATARAAAVGAEPGTGPSAPSAGGSGP
jgi:hypothetical protein